MAAASASSVNLDANLFERLLHAMQGNAGTGYGRVNPLARLSDFYVHPNDDWKTWLFEFELIGASEAIGSQTACISKRCCS